jgi:hypothetical protein
MWQSAISREFSVHNPQLRQNSQPRLSSRTMLSNGNYYTKSEGGSGSMLPPGLPTMPYRSNQQFAAMEHAASQPAPEGI